jgi:hypothetical protein
LYKHSEIVVYIWLRKLQNTQSKIKIVALYVCVPHLTIVWLNMHAGKFCGAFFYVLQISENPPSAKWERKKKEQPPQPRKTPQPTAAAPASPAASTDDASRERSIEESQRFAHDACSPHRSSSNFPTLHLPNPCSPPLTSAGGRPVCCWRRARLCSTERLHGLGSSSSFGGGGARSAASSNDLIVQAQIVPSSRLDFASILFPPVTAPKLSIDTLLGRLFSC